MKRLASIAVAAMVAAACNVPVPGASATDGAPEPTPIPSTDPGPATPLPDGSGSSESSGESSGSTGLPGQACAVCLPPVPDAWFGPVAVHDGEADVAAPGCNEAWPEPGLTHLHGLTDPGPAQCECGCAADVSALCPIDLFLYPGSTDCTGMNADGPFAEPNGCQAIDTYGVESGSILLFDLFVTPSSVCDDELTVTAEEPGWQGQRSACRAAQDTEACGAGGQCAGAKPEGYARGACIFREGDHACPEQDYTQRRLVFAGFDDDRFCSPCECGQEHDATCDGTWSLYASDDCSGDPVEVAEAFACLDIAGNASIAAGFVGDPSCPVATPPEPVGAVTPTGPLTYCCQPDAG